MKFILFPLAAAIALLSSCASSYNREFADASVTLPRSPRNAEGPWIGTWKSDTNGHTGPLWCIVEPSANNPGSYDFRYRVGWGFLKFGNYVHTVSSKRNADGSMKLSGEMALPSGLGTYQVEGLLTRVSFTATYRSAGDHGTFTLKRPAP